jgi:hypothetical protein
MTVPAVPCRLNAAALATVGADVTGASGIPAARPGQPERPVTARERCPAGHWLARSKAGGWLLVCGLLVAACTSPPDRPSANDAPAHPTTTGGAAQADLHPPAAPRVPTRLRPVAPLPAAGGRCLPAAGAARHDRRQRSGLARRLAAKLPARPGQQLPQQHRRPARGDQRRPLDGRGGAWPRQPAAARPPTAPAQRCVVRRRLGHGRTAISLRPSASIRRSSGSVAPDP